MRTLFILFLLIACGPQHLRDPNAYVFVTSKYENEPERIISPKGDECKPQLDCSKKTEAECAIALYNVSESFINEGKKLSNKELYLSARVEYMQAMTRLAEAEIRIKRIDDFDQWKRVQDFKLEQKLKERIKLCEKQLFLLKWKRT